MDDIVFFLFMLIAIYLSLLLVRYFIYNDTFDTQEKKYSLKKTLLIYYSTVFSLSFVIFTVVSLCFTSIKWGYKIGLDIASNKIILFLSTHLFVFILFLYVYIRHSSFLKKSVIDDDSTDLSPVNQIIASNHVFEITLIIFISLFFIYCIMPAFPYFP